MRTRTNWWHAAGAVFLVAGTLLLPMAAEADPADLAKVAQAKALIEQKKAAEAYALLEPSENALAGLVEFDYWFGVAALDSGKLDRAVIAFERVLIVQPNSASARLDLARAYFGMGNMDLAKQEFERLLAQNPTAAGRKIITEYLEEIERRARRKLTSLTGFLEVGGGYDNNLTSATANFTDAVFSSFGINNILPTGNSIRHSAPFGNAAAGFDFERAIGSGYSFAADADVKLRRYGIYSAFDSLSGGGHVGFKRKSEGLVLRADLLGQWLHQDGAVPITPDSPVLNNNRNITGFRFDAQYAPAEQRLYTGQCTYSRFRYPTNAVQDTNQTLCSVTWIGEWSAPRSRLLALSVFGGKDKALRLLNSGSPDIDVSRTQYGARAFTQWALSDTVDANLMLGYSVRRDDREKARAELIAIGRDKTFEAGGGFSWRFAAPWSLRAMVNYTRNDSNINLYDYARTEVSLTLRRDFE
ncbi:MAG: tetratricopeptide repeat protein [Betaproteobacteria bacterium]|nr:tetratricopeptide repeat protein [Betaproteobacteria bacterium]